MIKLPVFGLSHFVYSWPDPNAFGNFWTGRGFNCSPPTGGLNPAEKSPFVSGSLGETYQARFLRNSIQKFPTIECLTENDISYGTTHNRCFELYFGDSKEAAVKGHWGSNQFLSQDLPGVFFDDSKLNSLVGISIFSPDIDASAQFWEMLGGQTTLNSDDHKVTRFRPGIGSPSVSIYHCNSQPPKPMLNLLGWSCISFLSSNIQLAHQILSNLTSANVGDIFTLTVEDRFLDIFFFRTLGGEIYEFVGPSNAI